MSSSRIGVIGAGAMGNGVARICAAAGRLGRQSGHGIFSYGRTRRGQ